MNELSTINPEILASLIINGDIAKLSSAQRVEYITKLCERVGIDPLTQPFKILKLGGREVLYADKGCTQQLCKIYKISTEVTKKEKIEDVYVVTVRAIDNNGRYTDEDGAVTISSLKGDTLANALMKAVTKAKRRAVLAFCGLGMLDETEIETIKGAITVDNNEEPLKMPTPRAVVPLETPTTSLEPTIEAKPVEDTPKLEEPLKTPPNADLPISQEDGKDLMARLKASGRVKQDLIEFIFFTFNLEKLSEIKYKHMNLINQFIATPKAKDA